MRLDYRDNFPLGMEDYLAANGWHFSKEMAEWASSRMYRGNKNSREYIDPYNKEQVTELLNRLGLKLDNLKGYDDVYIANMCKADFLGDSIQDEDFLGRYVKNVIDDPDAYEGMPFTRFYADCIGSGTPIPWEDVL